MREELYVLKKMVCVALAVLMLIGMVGCGKGKTGEEPVDPQKFAAYIGTWQGSDHDAENVVNYLIFDDGGYWKVYMNYTPLVRAIRQLPNQLVSFSVFRKLQNSNHTGCYYEYVENGGVDYTDLYTLDEEGCLVGADENVRYSKVSGHYGEPSDEVVEQARDLFDRALIEANSK